MLDGLKVEYLPLSVPRGAVVGQVRVWLNTGHTIRASNRATSEPLMRTGSIVRIDSRRLTLVWPIPWPTAHQQHIHTEKILTDWIALHSFYRYAHGLGPKP